jgi:Mrp family chromosome partitioning ATPase
VGQAEPQIPVFESLPVFEEETGLVARPRGVARAACDERTSQGRGLRLLASRVRALGRDKRLRRIGVLGCGRGEGVSTIALGLARALARERERERVLHLELDLERPAVDEALGLAPPDAGLAHFLGGGCRAPVLRHPAPGLWVLSSGAPQGGAPFFGGDRLRQLMSAADRVFDFVVADCPPAASLRAAALGDAFDGFVFVVRSRHASRDAVRQAARLVAPHQLLGFVLNAQADLLGT